MTKEAYRDINALVVGAGSAGSYHTTAQKELGATVGVYDIDRERITVFEEAHGARPFFNLNDALDWATIVHICTPDNVRTEIVVDAVTRGKNILCEKPLATSLKDAQTIYNKSKNAKGRFFVGHNVLLDPAFVAIKKKVKDGEVGRLTSAYADYAHDMRENHKRTPWRINQNFLYGGATHPIYLLQHIVDEPVVAVSGMQTGVKLMPDYTQAEDYRITLQFASGLLAEVWTNTRVVLPVHSTTLKVFGEKATVEGNNKINTIKQYNEGAEDFKVESIDRISNAATVHREVQLVDDFLLGLSDSHAPIPSIDEAMDTMYVLDAIERSIREKRVVTVEYPGPSGS